MNKQLFFSFEPDPLKESAIDEFLSTPIDSRSSPTNEDFTRPISVIYYKQNRAKKAKPEKDIMKTWNKTINRISRNAIIQPKIKGNQQSGDHPSLAERALANTSEMRSKTPIAREIRPFPETEKTNGTARSALMPLRKNEVPVGRHFAEGLLMKRINHRE